MLASHRVAACRPMPFHSSATVLLGPAARPLSLQRPESLVQRLQPADQQTVLPRAVAAAADARPGAAAPPRSSSGPARSGAGASAPPRGGPGAAAPAPPPAERKKRSKKMVDILGEVNKDLSNGMFNVKLENGVSVIAHLSGKIRQNRIKIMVGDRVTVELSPYDLTKGRITFRHRAGEIRG